MLRMRSRCVQLLTHPMQVALLGQLVEEADFMTSGSVQQVRGRSK